MKTIRKLIPAIFALVVSAVIVASASFAWFSMTREVTATGMNMKVVAPSNMLISQSSADDSAWAGTTEFTSTAKSIVPASTSDGFRFATMKAGTATTSDGQLQSAVIGGYVTEGFATSSDAAFVDFDMYVKTQGETDISVHLSELTVRANEVGAVTKPIRVAVIYNDGTNDVAYIYKSSSDCVNHDGKVIEVSGSPATFALVDESYKTLTDTTTTLIPVSTTARKITVRVWFEGQDTLCLGSAANSDIDVDVKFSVVD